MRVLVTLLCAAALSFAANELSGRRAPGFSLPDPRIQRHDLYDYRGKWVLLDFMKTECPSCATVSQVLEQVKARYGDKLVIFSIVISPPETLNTVGNYIRANKVSATILFDQGQMTASYFNLSPVRQSFDTPHLFVIDPNGMIVRDWGYDQNKSIFSPGGLARELDPLIKK